MIQKLRNLFNSTRLNYISQKRKVKLSREIEKEKVTHLHKTINCEHEWYGSSYGGFFINPTLLNSKSIVYSFGIGKDITFDKTIMKKHGCKIYAFDPTPKSIDYIRENNPSDLFAFHDYGITNLESGLQNFYLPTNPKGVSGSLVQSECVNPNDIISVKMKSFKDITKELGHTHIDLLKMDIEGSEYDVLIDIINSNVTIKQLIVEFHDRLFDLENYRSKEIVNKLKDNGYEIFANSISYEEISFIQTR